MNHRGFNFGELLKVLFNKIHKHPVISAIIFSNALLLGCSLVLAKELQITFFEALFQMLPLLFGELGALEWDSSLARAAGVVGLFAGVGFITIIGASIVTWFVNFSLRGGRIMNSVKYNNHIIICGWNIQGNNIIRQLMSPDIAKKRHLVILANLPKRPAVDDMVDFISGDPTKEDDLKRAGIMTADTVIILTEFNSGAWNGVNPDAQAVLMTLAVETLRRDVYTCVQLFSSEYKKHLEHTHVDEYICLDRLSGNLMVSAALNHGLSWILGELLEFSSGSEFYKKNLPKEFVGMGFRDVAKILHNEKIILVAIETEEKVPLLDEEGKEIHEKDGTPRFKIEGKFIINPQEKDNSSDYKFKQNDKIFIIAVDEPTDREMKKIGEKSKIKKVFS